MFVVSKDIKIYGFSFSLLILLFNVQIIKYMNNSIRQVRDYIHALIYIYIHICIGIYIINLPVSSD